MRTALAQWRRLYMELFQSNKKYEAVGLLCEMEGGVTKEQLNQMLRMLPDNELLVPFHVCENNSQVAGFMTAEAANDHEIEVKALLGKLCEDWNNENPNKIYVTTSGLSIYVDCEFESIISN
jgi:cytosine/adenosine deaminase-related metal-dependent hydrolase